MRVKPIILVCFLPFFFLLILVLSITQPQQQGWTELQAKPLNIFCQHGPLVQWFSLQGTPQYLWCMVIHVSKVVREVVPYCLASHNALISQ